MLEDVGIVAAGGRKFSGLVSYSTVTCQVTYHASRDVPRVQVDTCQLVSINVNLVSKTCLCQRTQSLLWFTTPRQFLFLET